MTPDENGTFPAALTAVAAVAFDHAGGEGVDYEPFNAFVPAEETTHWLRVWTGNRELDGAAFKVFGQDGTGGHVAFWQVRPGRPVAEQPVVFLGSEGELGVLAGDLAGYLWLLAEGFGPYEATAFPQRPVRPSPELTAIAERYAPGRRRPAAEVIATARREFPDFASIVLALCRLADEY